MSVMYANNNNSGGLFDSLFPKLLGVGGRLVGGPVGGLVGNMAGNLIGGQSFGTALGNTAIGALDRYGDTLLSKGAKNQWNDDMATWRNSKAPKVNTNITPIETPNTTQPPTWGLEGKDWWNNEHSPATSKDPWTRMYQNWSMQQ